mmetsp:Transcript_56844/g.179799  ORF Transcript_56844/g.179799 Transcript_56844/m.179799 type:complete len:203 (+) Transcript_56844:1823-2431(+)
MMTLSKERIHCVLPRWQKRSYCSNMLGSCRKPTCSAGVLFMRWVVMLPRRENLAFIRCLKLSGFPSPTFCSSGTSARTLVFIMEYSLVAFCRNSSNSISPLPSSSSTVSTISASSSVMGVPRSSSSGCSSAAWMEPPPSWSILSHCAFILSMNCWGSCTVEDGTISSSTTVCPLSSHSPKRWSGLNFTSPVRSAWPAITSMK